MLIFTFWHSGFPGAFDGAATAAEKQIMNNTIKQVYKDKAAANLKTKANSKKAVDEAFDEVATYQAMLQNQIINSSQESGKHIIVRMIILTWFLLIFRNLTTIVPFFKSTNLEIMEMVWYCIF